MKPLDLDAIRRAARYPETRPQVFLLLDKAKEGLEKSQDSLRITRRSKEESEQNVARCEAELPDAMAAVQRWQDDVDRIETVLRESAGERAL